MRESLAAEEQRLRALEEMKGSREKGAQRVLDHLRARGERSDGTVASKLVPRAGWEGILDRLASEELDAVVIDGEGFEAASRLREAGVGGTVLGSGWQAPSAPGGWDGVLENFGELSPALVSILPPVLFVEDASAARAAARAHPGMLVASRSGEIVRGDLWRVPGSHPEAAGPLSLRREIEERRESIEHLGKRLSDCEARLAGARARRAEHEARAVPLAGERREAETAAAAHAARLAERTAERERQRREHETLRTEDEMLEQDVARLSAARRGNAREGGRPRARASSNSAEFPRSTSASSRSCARASRASWKTRPPPAKTWKGRGKGSRPPSASSSRSLPRTRRPRKRRPSGSRRPALCGSASRRRLARPRRPAAAATKT